MNAAFSGVRFKLTGPSGWTGFSDLADDSTLVTLPSNGSNQVEVVSNGAGFGSYAFRLEQTNQASLSLGTTSQRNLYGFRICTTFRCRRSCRHSAQRGPQFGRCQWNAGLSKTRVTANSPGLRLSERHLRQHSKICWCHLPPPGQWYILVYSNSVLAGHHIFSSSDRDRSFDRNRDALQRSKQSDLDANNQWCWFCSRVNCLTGCDWRYRHGGTKPCGYPIPRLR